MAQSFEERRTARDALDELRSKNAELEEASRHRDAFLSNMSHELRTPLSSIVGFAEMLRSDGFGPLTDKQRCFVDRIFSSSRHLLDLINDILDVAKADSGRLEIHPEPTDVRRLVEEVVGLLHPLAEAKGMLVDQHVDDELGEVMTDPIKLKQVLCNYLSNALKFTPDGGRVSIRVSRHGSAAFRVDVEDNGIGIRPEDVHLLFMEFQQLDSGMAKKYPGTGLGLALTRRVVEAQGGGVGVESTPGRGSLFFAVLPETMIGAAQRSPVAESAGPNEDARRTQW